MIHHLVYKVTNLINGMIYVGKHSTEDINDGYMGSGKYINRAIAKYGLENFQKEVLYKFGTEEEAFLKEAEIVNEEFVRRKDTYNITLGGFGSWYASNISRTPEIRRELALKMNSVTWSNDEFRLRKSKETSERNKRLHKEGKMKPVDRTGSKHSDEAKMKMKIAASNRSPEQNSQFGTCWITNGTKSVKIVKGSILPEGWRLGRKLSKNTFK